MGGQSRGDGAWNNSDTRAVHRSGGKDGHVPGRNVLGKDVLRKRAGCREFDRDTVLAKCFQPS